MNYEKYNKKSFKKDFTGGGGRGYPKMVTNGDVEERGVQKLPFLRWRPFWTAPKTLLKSNTFQ